MHFHTVMPRGAVCALLSLTTLLSPASQAAVVEHSTPHHYQLAGDYASSPLLLSVLLVFGAIIAVLAAAVMKFRQLNRALRAEVGERRAAEEALTESEERLRIIFETSQAGIVLVDPQGVIRFANNRMAEMFGISLERLVGSSYASHLHPQESATGNELMRQLIAGEVQHVNTERRYLSGSGDFWGYLTGKRLESPDGKLQALVGIISDMTDRIKAEEAQGKALMLVETLLAHSPMGIVVFDGESGECIRVNRAAVEISGGGTDVILGRSFRDSASWRDSGLLGVSEEVLSDGVPRPFEAEFRNSSGREVTLRCYLSRFEVEERAHLMVLGQDITEEKRLDRENKRIEAQMLNMQKLESLGVLAGGIAHDFNNILTGIMGNVTFAQLALDPSHQARGPLAKAEKACQRAAELASQLLTFARGGKPVKREFSVRNLVRESASLVLRGTNVKAKIEFPAALAIIEADEGQINQAFNNIIINAVHAMPGGGLLTITGSDRMLEPGNRLGLEPGSYVKLTFSDEGCGISETDLKRIFDPYFTTKASGTGLGLASTHSIVSRHGGIVLVDSTQGRGTCFTIYLPSTGKCMMEAPAKQEAEGALPCGGSVLVMDDEEMIRELACGLLGELGYAVRSCGDGAEAVELYREALKEGTPYRAVIMDLTIPGGMGGKESARLIRELDRGARLIVSSGYSNDPVISDYRRFGFCATLEKPYGARELRRALASALPGESC